MTSKAFRGLFLCAVLGALVFRAARLELRPMHHDEANQASKFGDLLETGVYRYDPIDHHGPSLYYLTLPFARAAGQTTYASLTETTLRLVPVLFGTAVLAAFLLFAGGLSREGIFFAALFTALSPIMTYYSRFYIQETLLVFFLAALIGAGWRYFKTRSAWWAAAAGLAAGLMYATKETSLILFAAIAAALALERLVRSAMTNPAHPADAAAARMAPIPPFQSVFHAVLFLAVGFGVAALLYTSFFANPRGLTDSVRAFGTYFGRAANPGVHAEPWYFYIRMLAYSRFGHGPLWSEAFVLALAIAGGIAGLGSDGGKDGQPRFVRSVLFFTVISAAVFSAIPYKTPWNAMPFYLGVLILAGNGAALLWRAGRFLIVKAVVLAVLIPGFANLALQDYRANFKDYANPENPYVYAQTSSDFLGLVKTVEGAAAASPEKKDTLIKVLATPEETWPLPWYLRRFTRVGYWTDAASAGVLSEAPIVIAGAGASESAGPALGDRYQACFFGLRPEVVLCAYIRQDLWDAYLKAKTAQPPVKDSR